jgi:ribose transport system substrate-binding protein
MIRRHALGRLFRSLAIGAAAMAAACGDAPRPAASQTGGAPAPPTTGPAPAAAKAPKRIAVIPKGTSHEFWKSVEAGARDAGTTLGIIIDWKGPAREDDRDDQIKVVEDYVTRKVDGIVIAPLDAEALVRPLREAKDAGIPCVVIDSDLAWDGYEAFVATDNRKGGEIAARELGTLLGGKGKVVVLRYVEGSASTNDRETGFLTTIAAEFPGIAIVSSDQYGGATLESCLRAAENLLNRFPAIDGAYAPNEPSAAALMKAIDEAKRKTAIRLVGFDARAELVAGLASGKIDALVVQSPYRMGELGVRAMADVLAKRPVERRIDTGCTLVTKATMDSPEGKAALGGPRAAGQPPAK